MAIRRRRKTLTNLLSSMERRVTTVELRPINLLTSAQVAAATAGDDEELDGGPNSVVGPNAPNQYKPVEAGYFYSKRVTGGGPLVELYFESDTGLEVGKTIRVSGINKLENGGSPIDFDISKDYRTIAIDTPPYEGRNSYRGQRDTPGSNITNTAMFNPGIATEYTSRRTIITKLRISTVEATTTTAKIVFTGANHFKANQVVFVNLPDTVFYGLDGLWRIKEVGSNFITYDFPTALEEPINVTNVTEQRHVHAVAQSAVRDGATWFDTSVTPNVGYVWQDIRWVLISAATDIPDDDISPNPPTDLQATSENSTPPGATQPQSRITVTWDAPTTNVNGTPIDDLAFYEIEARQSTNDPWVPRNVILATTTTWTGEGFLQARTAYIRIRAVDSGENFSTWAEISHMTIGAEPEVTKPKAPAVTTYLGTIKIAYDDLTAFGTVQAETASEIEVFRSTIPGFTPGPDSFYGKFPANAGSFIIIPGTELVDNTDYYIRIRVRDIYGNFSEPSNQVTIRAQLKNIVKFDMIDVGTLTAQAIIGLQLWTNNNPSVNGGIVINRDGIVAYRKPSTPGGEATPSFRLIAETGSVIIGDYLGRDEAEQFYLSKLDGAASYATVARANSIALLAGNADEIARAVRGDLANLDERFKSITSTTIEPGRISIRKDRILGSLNSDINVSNTTTIEGGAIRAGSIEVNKLTVTPLVKGGAAADINDPANTTTISGGKITTNTINVNRLIAGTLTGFRIQTSSSGKRIVIDEGENRISFWRTTTEEAGRIEAGDGSNFVRYDSRGTSSFHSFFVNGTLSANISSAGLSLPAGKGISVPTNGTLNVTGGGITADGGLRGDFVRSGTGTVFATLHSNGSISTGSGTAPDAGVISSSGSLRAGTTVVVGTMNTAVSGASANVRWNGAGNALLVLSSDARVKDKIEPLTSEDGLELVKKLRPVTYDSRIDNEDKRYSGFIAQDIEEVFKDSSIDLVGEISSDGIENMPDGVDGPLKVFSYETLVPFLTKAIQELSTKNDELETRLRLLEGGS